MRMESRTASDCWVNGSHVTSVMRRTDSFPGCLHQEMVSSGGSEGSGRRTRLKEEEPKKDLWFGSMGRMELREQEWANLALSFETLINLLGLDGSM